MVYVYKALNNVNMHRFVIKSQKFKITNITLILAIFTATNKAILYLAVTIPNYDIITRDCAVNTIVKYMLKLYIILAGLSW